MKLIYFFDEKIKPFAMKGKKYANPAETGIIGEGISCIREHDVNFWFYTKGKTSIAFDAGHLHYENIEKEFEKIAIKREEISYLFLTHADVDHAGGIDSSRESIFPNAKVYLGKKEEDYLNGRQHRFTRLGIKIYNCVKIKEGYQLLDDGQIIEIDGIRIEALHIPGHTLGHMCYIVDDRILISGDCLAINEKGGYSFFDFFNQSSDLNKKSLRRLKEIVEKRDISLICTGHSGCRKNTEKTFLYIDRSAHMSRKKPFDPLAPHDPFA